MEEEISSPVKGGGKEARRNNPRRGKGVCHSYAATGVGAKEGKKQTHPLFQKKEVIDNKRKLHSEKYVEGEGT